MSKLANFCRGHFVPLPTQGGEWLFMRLLFAALVFSTILDGQPFDYHGQPYPSGLARLVDLTWIHSLTGIDLPFYDGGKGLHETFVLLGAVLCAAYASGRGLLVVLPLLTLLHIIPRTLSNSQGFTHHGVQLVSQVLLVQSLVVGWAAVRRWRGRPDLPGGLGLPSFLIYYSQGVVAFSYVVTAMTKLIKTKGLWALQSHRIALELIESHRLDYYKDLDPAKAGDPTHVVWLLEHSWLTRGLFGAGLALELFAFLALRSRPWALFIGLSTILMHRCIWALMRLEFPMHEALIAIFLVNVPFWVWWLKNGRATGLSAK